MPSEVHSSAIDISYVNMSTRRLRIYANQFEAFARHATGFRINSWQSTDILALLVNNVVCVLD